VTRLVVGAAAGDATSPLRRGRNARPASVRPSRGGIEIRLHLSRQEIADLVGTTVESAIRVMSRWGREGLVVTRQDGFLIPSMDSLRAVAEGPPEG
jgi:CRP-like cAMP-binding protein